MAGVRRISLLLLAGMASGMHLHHFHAFGAFEMLGPVGRVV